MSQKVQTIEDTDAGEFREAQLCRGNACNKFGLRVAERWPNTSLLKRVEIHNASTQIMNVTIQWGNILGPGNTVSDTLFPGRTNVLSVSQAEAVIGFISVSATYQ